MVGILPAEFPKERDFADAKELVLASKMMLNGIEKTIFYSATDELRPIMTSVYFDIVPGQINFVSSDGHKLALLEIPMESMTDTNNFALPLKMAQIIRGTFKPSDEFVKIYLSRNSARFEYETESIDVTLVEGRFQTIDQLFLQTRIRFYLLERQI